MEQNEFDEKIKYAQNIINILQTKLNESVAQNVQLEATVTVLKEKVDEKIYNLPEFEIILTSNPADIIYVCLFNHCHS